MSKPSEVAAVKPVEAKPSTVKVEKKRPKSEPVRNPAFREHEGLRALQKQLNSQRPVSRNKK